MKYKTTLMSLKRLIVPSTNIEFSSNFLLRIQGYILGKPDMIISQDYQTLSKMTSQSSFKVSPWPLIRTAEYGDQLMNEIMIQVWLTGNSVTHGYTVPRPDFIILRHSVLAGTTLNRFLNPCVRPIQRGRQIAISSTV